MPVNDVFHPEDLVALGLCLGAVACARRSWWIGAGVVLGLAVMTQQYALLVAGPLLVLAPRPQKLRFVSSAAAAAVLVALPLVAGTGGRAFKPAVLGSSAVMVGPDVRSVGGSILWELHLHGLVLVALSRVLPIALAMAVAYWAQRRLGARALDPVPLLAIVAVGLGLRLPFEQNFFGYYMMALAVSLVLLDLVRRRVRGTVVTWLALVTLAVEVNQITYLPEYVPTMFVAIALAVVLIDALRGRVRWYLVAFVVLAVAAFINAPPSQLLPSRSPWPMWFWQIALVVTGLPLAFIPLWEATRSRGAEVRGPALEIESVWHGAGLAP
jgi:hypothetical protein